MHCVILNFIHISSNDLSCLNWLDFVVSHDIKSKNADDIFEFLDHRRRGYEMARLQFAPSWRVEINTLVFKLRIRLVKRMILIRRLHIDNL